MGQQQTQSRLIIMCFSIYIIIYMICIYQDNSSEYSSSSVYGKINIDET